MKAMLISFAVGLAVGVLYGVIRVKSPAPPIIALAGLLGMVFGEPIGQWIVTRNVNVAHAISVCLMGEPYQGHPPVAAQPDPSHEEGSK